MLKRNLLIAGGVLAACIVLLLGYAATQPDNFRVERSIVINAGPEVIVSNLQDFRRWQAWSPWEKVDPAMKRTYGGADSGPTANYTWEGNSQVGRGRMEILSVTLEKVTIMLDFYTPWEAHNIAEFTLVPQVDRTTKVTWAMFGPNPFISKLMTVFVSMDSMVAKDFESGLKSLKTISEKG